MNGLNAIAVPVISDALSHPSLTSDERRTVHANLSGVFVPPDQVLVVRWERGGTTLARLRVDGKIHEFHARSIPQLLMYVHDFNLARRTRAA